MGTLAESQEKPGGKDDLNSTNALPCPFANQNSVQTSPTISAPLAKTFQPQYHIQGYRSNFDIHQQKLSYEQRKQEEWNQRQQQAPNQDHQKPNWNNRPFHHNKTSFNQNDPKNSGQFQKHNDSISFWCDACDRGFPNEFTLSKHIDEHERCCFDGCKFEGHSQLLRSHIEMHHDSGLFQKITKIETDEDVEKWREERRKRYPTKENVELRRLAQKARLKRGERIAEPKKKFGDKNERRGMNNHNRAEVVQRPVENIKNKKNNRQRKRKPRKSNNQTKVGDNKCVKTEAEEDNVSRFKGISILEERQETKAPTPSNMSNGLTDLMALYGSSDLSEEEEDEIIGDATRKPTGAEQLKEKVQNNSESNVGSDVANEASVESAIGSEQNIEKHNSDDESPMEECIRRQPTAEVGTRDEEKYQFPETDQMDPPKAEVDVNSDDEPPEEQSIQKTTSYAIVAPAVSDPKPVNNTNKRPSTTAEGPSKKTMRKSTLSTKTEKIRKQNTLLEKLLQGEIRHERNVLLQCVRYVVENNFFGVGQSSGN